MQRLLLLVFLFTASLSPTLSKGQTPVQATTTSNITISYPDTLHSLRRWLPPAQQKGNRETATRLAEKILSILEQNGFPFAEVQLFENAPTHSFLLKVIANHYIVWDSVVVKGEAKLSPRFLAPYLKVKRGKPYNESIVTQAEASLNALEYVTQLRPPQPSFTPHASALYVYLDKKNANTFEGFAGFSSREEGRGLQLTGHLNLKLTNLFGHGESFAANWERIETNRQMLSLEANYPCLWQTPFCLYGQFSLFRHDTGFYRLSLPVGLRYLIRGTDYLQLYYRFENSSRIGNDTGLIQRDYRSNNYGIALRLRQTDHLLLPHKGYHWEAGVETGSKKNRENRTNSGTLSGTTWSGNMQGMIYLPIGKRWVLASRLLTGFISDKQLYESNLFLMGGLRSMRGVNEQSLKASAYLFVSEEIRFFLNDRLFVHAFTDGGWYERALPSAYYRDTPLGVGVGFSLLTGGGLFSMSYAIAAHDKQPFMVKSSKISVGYNAFF